MPSIRLARVTLAAALAALLSGCAAPPSKELSQAQGALDAARAAGAAEYAAEEFTAASDALARAHQSVAERDYRAALSHALDSSARAQAAAKSAVEGRVRARLAAEQTIGEATEALEHVRALLTGSEARRVPPAARRRAQQVAADADTAITTAREAVERGDLSAAGALTAHREALIDAATALAPPAAAPRGRSRS